MAEKKSINIGGDASIIGAAGNLARSQQPFSMEDMTKGFVTARGNMLETQSDRFVANQKAIEAMNDGVKKSIKDLETQINDGTIDVEAERNIAQGKVDAWREELKNIPRGKAGKEARDKLLWKVNKYTKGRQNVVAAGISVIETIKTDNYDVSQLDAGQLALIGHFSEVAKDPDYTADGFSKKKNKDGNYVYTHAYEGADGKEQIISGDIFEIQEFLGVAAPQDEFVDGVNDYIHGIRQEAVDNPDQEFSVVRDSIKSRLKGDFNTNHAGFLATINKNIGLLGKSYVETLNNEDSDEYQSIITALIELNPSEFDFDGDGTVEADDFEIATTDNINEMIRALTRPKPGEKVLAHDLAAMFYADGEAKKAYGIGEAKVAKSEADAEKIQADKVALERQKSGNAVYLARVKAETAENLRLRKLGGAHGFGVGMNSLNVSNSKNLKTFKFGTAGEAGSVSTNYTGNDLEMSFYKFMNLEASGKGDWGTHQNGHSYKYDNGQWSRLGSDDDSGKFKPTTRKTVMDEMMLLGNVVAMGSLSEPPFETTKANTLYELHKTIKVDAAGLSQYEPDHDPSSARPKTVTLFDMKALRDESEIVSLKTGIKYGALDDYVPMPNGKGWARESDPETAVIWKIEKDDGWASSIAGIHDTQLIARILEDPASLNPSNSRYIQPAPDPVPDPFSPK